MRIVIFSGKCLHFIAFTDYQSVKCVAYHYIYERKPSILKQLLFLFLVITAIQSSLGQSYVDLAKINYTNVVNAGYEDTNQETTIRAFDAALTIPMRLTQDVALITGIEYSNQTLSLFPGAEEAALSYATVRAGVAINHSEKWSGTYMILPKVASEKLKGEDDFFIGGLVLLKYQKNEFWQYRIGGYGSAEAFGAIVTPILGWYYQKERWESTLNFPINGDVNYSFNPGIRTGFAFQAPVRSYRLAVDDDVLIDPRRLHVQSNIIELGPYFEHGFLDNSILLRFQVGYSSVDYEVYNDGDRLPFRLFAFEFDDDRNRLNPEMNGNLFLRIGAVYRFDLDREEALSR